MNHIRKISSLAASACFLLLLPTIGFSQEPGAMDRAPDIVITTAQSASSYDYLRNIHAVNAAAITAGEAALARSNSEAIRSYATMLVGSHEALARQAERIANSEKVDLNRESAGLTRFLGEATARVNDADAASFNETFLTEVGLITDQAIKMTETVSGQLRLVQVRQLSADALSTLRDQKTRAEQLSTQLLGH